MTLLPLGLRFRFHSQLTLDEARRAVRAKTPRFPGKIDQIWGFAMGRLVFLQEGMLSNSSSLFAWIDEQDGALQVRGAAGVNFLALLGLAVGFGIIVPIFILLFRAPQKLDLLWSLGVFALVYGVAWLNHIFRREAEPLMHFLQRALQAEELAVQDEQYSDEPVHGATLSIDECEQASPPSARSVREAILELGPYHFAILAFADEQFAQVMNEGGHYRVEWRDGSAERHFRLKGKPDSRAAVEAMVHYLANRSFQPNAPLEQVDLA